MVYPVVHALHKSSAYKNGEISIDVLALPAAKAILKSNDVEYFGLDRYLDKAQDADAIRWGTELAKEHHSPTIGIPLEDSVAYLGLNYKDLVTRLGEDGAATLFKEKSRHAFLPLTIMERVFDDIKPDFVITTNSPRSEAAAIAVANKRGIRNLIMVDLPKGLSHYKLQGQHVTFLNEFAKDMYVADGLFDESKSQCYYTGNPAFDNILSFPKDKDPDWVSTHFPNAGSKPVVLHIDMPAYWDSKHDRSYYKTDDDVKKELQATYDAAMANNAYYITRPHPSQDRNLHIGWLKDKTNAELAADCDFLPLLRNVDLIIVRSGTVNIQAVYMQQKIVQLDADFHSDLPIANMGVAWGVNDYSELQKTIGEALADDHKIHEMAALAKKLFPFQPAAQTITDIILENLKKTAAQSA